MTIHLKPVTRDNWEDALELKLKSAQIHLVPSPAVSLAKIGIKPDGDSIEYLPFGIYHAAKMVGFIMHARDEATANMYWINGFLIDSEHQGKGYGRDALAEMIRWIKEHNPNCREIRLTVRMDNEGARKLYGKMGFQATGVMYGDEEVWVLENA
ncbi:GNAT family N-acetyltransferase [Metabacillus sp. KIGAM252]|uniref:GNAT family N-acetyltransferase n=1 Tax=Metabacillus flavus TaxID=2823519 RepID=A0ABS5LAY8_9BACI|nr:GNAT family N-acetyltransferase [Metabacillus flavus]MBS2967880.1 GNAT family N-acetyltransferase [Metabacillus flavus]